MNFDYRLNTVLMCLEDIDTDLDMQTKAAERKAAMSANLSGKSDVNKTVDQKRQEKQKAEQEKLKNSAQVQQLQQQVDRADKQIQQLQARITGGDIKTTDMDQLNQLLSAKREVTDKISKLQGDQP